MATIARLKRIRFILVISAVILFVAGGITILIGYTMHNPSYDVNPSESISVESDSSSSETDDEESSDNSPESSDNNAETEYENIFQSEKREDDSTETQETSGNSPYTKIIEGFGELQSEEKNSDTSETQDTNVDSEEQESALKKIKLSLLSKFLLVGGAACFVAFGILSIIIYRMSVSLPHHNSDTKLNISSSAAKKASGNMNNENSEKAISGIFQYAQINCLGKRPQQEDSCGVLPFSTGIMAVLADGMGGLKDGERISQLVVRSMLEHGQKQRDTSENGVLLPMLNATNEIVNRTLGADVYKSGSTMLAAWVQENGKNFQWVAVGDSRIYLYRGGSLIQLNQEHNYGQELLKMAIKGQISFDEARKSPKKGELTSFIGMGKLKYIDYSVRPIELQKSDRIVIMSDGVFNSVSDLQIAKVLHLNSNIDDAAKQLAHLVEQARNPKQDNYSAVILGL